MITTDDAFDAVASNYPSAALLLLLEETSPAEFEGVAGAVVYCAAPPLSSEALIERDFNSRDLASKLKSLIVSLSADEARDFVAGLYTGRTRIPATDYFCTFHLNGSESGFTSSSSGGWSDTGENVKLLGTSHWSRRHRSHVKRIRGIELSTMSLVDIVAALPKSLPARLRPLELELRLEALGDFFELAQPTVDFHTSRTNGGMKYELRVLVGSGQEPFNLYVRTYRSNMLVSSEAFDVVPGSGEIPLPADFGRIDYELVHGRIFVDSFSGNFVDSIQTRVGLSEAPLLIDLEGSGKSLVSIDRAPSQYLHATVGVPRLTRPPLNNAAETAGKDWRADLSSEASFSERVFTALPPASRLEGLRYFADLVAYAITKAGATEIYLVDQYGIDLPALLRVAAASAKVTGGIVKLLTRNLPPPTSNAIPSPAPDYETFARRVARRLGVTIERYVPTRDVHDRYILIGDRVWHVGHSFNQLGSDVSAIVEIRSIRARRAALSVFEAEYNRAPAAIYK